MNTYIYANMKLLRYFSLLSALCFLFKIESSFAQICIELPPINSAPVVGGAPPGWSVWQESPDIISGNGPWPGGGYTVSDVNGTSAAGGTMGMFLHNGGTSIALAEGWQTTLTGLTIGQSYSISCEWQQATLSGFVTYSGGNLLVTVNGVPSLFTSSGGATDPWQVATVTFTATATTALYQIRVSEFPSGPGAFYGSFVVVDNYTCATVPPFSVALNTGSICEGACFNLQATPSNAVGTVNYAWNIGITSTGPGPISVCPTTTTTYTVTATDGAGTVSSSSTTITVNPVPIVDLGNDTLVCNGAPFTLNAGNPGATYTWNNSTSAQTLNVSSNGTYWVSVANGGCTANDTIIVDFQTSAVNLGNDITLCNGETVDLDAGNPGSSYLWSDNSTGQTLTVSTSGTYWVEVNAGNCSDSDTIVVSTQNASVNLGPDSTVCQGASVVFDAGNPGATYLWNNSSVNQTLTASSTGEYSVEVTVGGCTVSDTVLLNVVDLQVNLGNDTTLCETPSLVLDAGNPGASYLWSDNSVNQQLNVSSVGTYWVEVTQGLCTASDTIQVDFQAFSVSLGNDTVLCEGASLQLDAGNPGATYLWNTNVTTQSISVSSSGTYWVQSALGNCVDADTIVVTVVDIDVNLGNDTSMCNQVDMTLDAGNPGATYLWNDNSTNQQLDVNAQGIYWVTATLAGCSDSDTLVIYSQNLTASFFAEPLQGCAPMSVQFVDESFIAGGSIVSWDWDFGNGEYSVQQHPEQLFYFQGTYDISLTVTSDLGCTSTLSIPSYIELYPSAVASFTGPTEGLGGEDLVFTNTSNASSWWWLFDGEDTYFDNEVIYAFDSAGIHEIMLVANNEFGCPDTTIHYVNIRYEPVFFVPNTFTPDGDEFNQNWNYYLSNIDAFDFSMKVFNRWGEVVWESKNTVDGWDGTYNGRLVESGTYIWRMEFGDYYDGLRYVYTGHVNVLR